MKNKQIASCFGVVTIFILLLLTSFTASAGTVKFAWTDEYVGGEVTADLDGYGSVRANSGWGVRVYDRTGGDYTGSLLPDDSGQESLFSAFCLDITDHPGPGSTFTVGSLSDSVGQSKADDISRLMYNVYPTFSRNGPPGPWFDPDPNKQALALQIAIWEIVHENSGSAYDVYHGDISFRDDTFKYEFYDALDVASFFLNQYVNGKTGPMLDNLAALIHSDKQNILVQVNAVPIPAAVWLFGSAFAGLIGFGKRRKS